MSSYKRFILENKKKLNFDNETTWNYLFLNPNAVANAFSSEHQISKGKIFNKDDSNLAARMGQIEAQIIKETKDWMQAVGVNIKAIQHLN